MHMPPRGFNIGRGMKINKEEILGMYVALEKFINQDHDKVWKQWEEGVAHINNAIKKVDGVQTEVTVNALGNHTPTLQVSWDKSKVKISKQDLITNLRNGNPSIEVGGGGPDSFSVTVWMMKPGQEKIVAKRLTEELSKATA
jgi:L-seryl-tRNA(Ser) seleniumtransferase